MTARASLAGLLAGLLDDVRRRLHGRDLALIAAGLTFYAGIAVVPLMVLTVALTAQLTSTERVRTLAADLSALLPAPLGAPDAVTRLIEAGLQLTAWQGLLALLPMSLYGEGLRRALLRFADRRESLTGWRGRALALPLLAVAPLLLYLLLLAADVMSRLAQHGGFGAGLGRIAVGFYAVLAALTGPLMWGFRVLGSVRLDWRALVTGAAFTAACLSGFLQGFVIFLGLPLDLGAPFGDLAVVGGVVAVGLWLFLLHLVLLCGWLITLALDDRLRRKAPAGSPRAAPAAPPGARPPSPAGGAPGAHGCGEPGAPGTSGGG